MLEGKFKAMRDAECYKDLSDQEIMDIAQKEVE